MGLLGPAYYMHESQQVMPGGGNGAASVPLQTELLHVLQVTEHTWRGSKQQSSRVQRAHMQARLWLLVRRWSSHIV